MKSVFVVLCFLLFLTTARTQSCLDQSATQIATEVKDGLRKDKSFPAAQKIMVLSFVSENNSAGNTETILGSRLAAKTETELTRMLTKSSHQVLIQDKFGKKFFTPPVSPEETDAFYKQYKENNRPDYFLVARYYINAQTTELSITGISLVKNSYSLNDNKTACAFENINVPIPESEQNELLMSDVATNNNADYYAQLMQFAGNTQLISFDLYDHESGLMVEAGSILHIDRHYDVKVQVLKPCAVFVLMYMENDGFITPLSPYDSETAQWLQPGTYNLPEQGFLISPPMGEAAFKVIAVTDKNVKIEMQKSVDDDGYTFTNMNMNNAQVFLIRLKQIAGKGIPVDARFKTFTIKQ